MTEAELFAKAVLVFKAVVEAQGENEIRRLNGDAPAYRDGTGLGWPWAAQIEHELHERSAEAQRRVRDEFISHKSSCNIKGCSGNCY